eukprot:m.875835 g.875835  ORF g.875835 m.875835 type:complete len:291 (-) comp23578_c0_seq44:2417-3289(-)
MNFASDFANYGAGYDAHGGNDYRIDTNIVAIPMSALPLYPGDGGERQAPSRWAYGAPELVCRACSAVFNRLTSTFRGQEGGHKWDCEFCGFSHRVPDDTVMHLRQLYFDSEVADYDLGPVALGGATRNPRTLLCIDVSGSMCVSTQLPSNNAWTCPRCTHCNPTTTTQCSSCGTWGDAPAPQPEEYVSRLDAVKHMITSQLAGLCQQNPDACVGVVTFNDGVDVYGDGTVELCLGPMYLHCLGMHSGVYIVVLPLVVQTFCSGFGIGSMWIYMSGYVQWHKRLCTSVQCE